MTRPTQSEQATAVQRARAAAAAMKFHKAVALCDKGLHMDEDDAFVRHRLYNKRGAANNRLGQHTLAIADLSMAIRMPPSSWLSVYNRHSAYRSIGATKEALQVHSPAHFCICQTGYNLLRCC